MSAPRLGRAVTADGVLCLAVPALARWTVVAVNAQGQVYFVFSEVRFMRRRNAEKWISRAAIPEGTCLKIVPVTPT